ncbi:MAG: hypothetical protein AB8G26_02635, partial [Ilumatobacter sp.]
MSGRQLNMFTGIVEELGRVAERDGSRLRIDASEVLQNVQLGDSIAVNGCCLTVVRWGDAITTVTAPPDDESFFATWWEADVTEESYDRTDLGDLQPGDAVNSWETLAIDDPAKNDVAFVNDLLDLMIEDYCVDETRVYSTGMSGGGLFTSQLVCEMPDRIAAAASVAAISFHDSCDPAQSVPFIAIHGTEDGTVPFDGDLTGTRFEGEEFATTQFSVPMPDQFAQVADVMGCDPEGERGQVSTDILTTT